MYDNTKENMHLACPSLEVFQDRPAATEAQGAALVNLHHSRSRPCCFTFFACPRTLSDARLGAGYWERLCAGKVWT